MRTFLHDLRIAVRLLRQRPGLSTACIVTLALGIGANTTIYSFADAVLFRPLPVPNADRIVHMYELFGVAAHDSIAFAAAPLAIVVVACLASYLPARRATRVSPLTALRVD